MSDQPEIQDSPAVPQGAQQPLERRGNEQSVTFRSFPPAPEVQGSSARLISPNLANGAASRPVESVNSMFCSAPVAVSVRPVDRKTVEGSTPGDFRAKGVQPVMPANPAPRQPVGQANLNSRIPAAPATSFPDESDLGS